MKKLSLFLSAVLVFMMLAAPLGTVENVQAFQESEINFRDFSWGRSGKKGENVYISTSIDYATAATVDVTGWKAALCPTDNRTLAAAVVTFDLTNENKNVNDQYKYASVYCNGTLDKDITGAYAGLVFDAQGNMVSRSWNEYTYVDKTLMSMSCDMMNNDGYVYAYVYSKSPEINVNTYPTLYAADKTTALTTFNNYTVTGNDYGDTIHVYRLNVLDPSQFVLGEDYEYFYFKVNGANVMPSPADNDGFGWTNVFDAHKRAADWGYEVKDPFAGGGTAPAPEVQTTGLAPAADGNWYLYNNGVIDSNYSGLYCDSNYGWWLIKNGAIDFGYTGLYNDVNCGWWLIDKGAIAFYYNGLYNDANCGWWLINNGAIDFGYNGLYNDAYCGWWLINNGAVNFGYNGLCYDVYCGWWKINGGAVDFGYTGLYNDVNCGWWLVNGGAIDFGFTGLYEDANYGWWAVKGGAVDFGYTGTYEWYGGTYNIVNGALQ